MRSVTLVALLSLAQSSRGNYIPGYRPTSYAVNEEIDALVDHVSSPLTQVPYDYHSLGFCETPSSFVKKRSSSLGTKLQGGAVQLTHYLFESKKVQACEKLCAKLVSSN